MKHLEHELDDLLKQSLEMEKEPCARLNDHLKAALYQEEAALRKAVPVRCISLWYLPMLFNLVVFSLLGAGALLFSGNPFVGKLLAGICVYFAAAGIFLTILGVRRTNMKKEIIIRIERRESRI